MTTLLLILAVCAYFFPTLLAALRGCRAGGGILLLNLFTGWTGVGWLVALLWALTGACGESLHPKQEILHIPKRRSR